MTLTKIVSSLLLSIFLVAHPYGYGNPSEPYGGKSWIPSGFPLESSSETSTAEAEQWALCSATLEIFSDVVRNALNKPDTATSIKNYANGAAMAVYGVFIMRFANEAKDLSPEQLKSQFKRVADYAGFAYKDYPEHAKVRIGAMRENSPNQSNWLFDLSVSAESCMRQEVLAVQQLYIDAARSILFGTPK